MRFVTYDADGGPRAGLLRGNTLVDAGPGGVGKLLRDEGLPDAVADTGQTVELRDARLLPPVTDPQKIVCMGLNYREHAAEAGLDPPETPTFFAKFPNALAPPGI